MTTNTTRLYLPCRFDLWISETFVRSSLFRSSSGSCHSSDVTWQEIGRMRGSVCSCPHPGSHNISPSLFIEHRSSFQMEGRRSMNSDKGSYTPMSCHVTSLPWQEPDEELNKLLLMKTRGQLHTDVLPRHITTMARTGRRTEQTASDEDRDQTLR